ncbi:MAG: tyrosine-protein phosphatase [Verrucomicrobiae bacterium]|nr:tyrosine-protein phosphatase [Verrucomicrobiae bacterium]
MNILPPSFRDVGATVNRLCGHELMMETLLYRSGEILLVESLSLIGNPKTIVNLEEGRDRTWGEGEIGIHLPFPNTSEVYDPSSPDTVKWIGEVLNVLGIEGLKFPVLVHCAAGKDRTGAIIAVLLSLVGIPSERIVAEYSESEGPLYPLKVRELIEFFARNTVVSSCLISRLKKRFLARRGEL